ncbi:MAG: putative sulfate exporter family transporter [Chloroflexi bacterium]|nr:putative sulfate exporter family transporter [Chloroflexota bacterium]
MSSQVTQAPAERKIDWSSLWKKEDWWAVYVGLFLVAIVFLAMLMNPANSPLNVLKGAMPIVGWPTKNLIQHFATNWPNYVFMYLLLLVLTGVGATLMGDKVGNYVKGFTLLFLIGLVILIIGSQETINHYGLEYPFWAIVIGMIVGNVWTFPEWFQAVSKRTEFFIKTGIILLGAALSFTQVVAGGGWGFLEALIIVAAGFTVAFIIGKALGFDNKFAAVLGAGASVCGVSAAIAIGSSVKNEEKKTSYVVSLVIIYALVLIFLLPFLAKVVFNLNDYVAGAWIGGSELADAAGLASAGIIGDKAVQAFSLVKLNRDVMIGFLCLIMGWLAITSWEKVKGGKVDPMVIWYRFPKFVIAFFLASFIVTSFVVSYTMPVVSAQIVANLNTIRTWLFVLAFLCIGLNTKFREMQAMGGKPLVAFTIVAVVNVVLGFICANLFFGGIIAAPLH